MIISKRTALTASQCLVAVLTGNEGNCLSSIFFLPECCGLCRFKAAFFCVNPVQTNFVFMKQKAGGTIYLYLQRVLNTKRARSEPIKRGFMQMFLTRNGTQFLVGLLLAALHVYN